jgi:hypothetical protein
VQADAVAGGQFNDAGGGVPDFRHPPLHLVVEPEHFQKMPVENFPRRRQLEEAAMPLRQPDAECAFQGPEQVAGVGLGAVVPFRRTGEVFVRTISQNTLMVPICTMPPAYTKDNFSSI